jgi:hypothetical protein
MRPLSPTMVELSVMSVKERSLGGRSLKRKRFQSSALLQTARVLMDRDG